MCSFTFMRSVPVMEKSIWLAATLALSTEFTFACLFSFIDQSVLLALLVGTVIYISPLKGFKAQFYTCGSNYFLSFFLLEWRWKWNKKLASLDHLSLEKDLLQSIIIQIKSCNEFWRIMIQISVETNATLGIRMRQSFWNTLCLFAPFILFLSGLLIHIENIFIIKIYTYTSVNYKFQTRPATENAVAGAQLST